MEGEVENIDAA